MRTTINLPDDLLLRLKKEALDSGSTLTALIESALWEQLARKTSQRSARRPVELTTCGSGGLMPGVDLDNSAALLDFMESDTDSYGR